MTKPNLNSRSTVIALAMLGGCVINFEPVGDDELGDTTSGDGDGDPTTTSDPTSESTSDSTTDSTDTTSDTSTDTTDTTTDTTGDGDCDNPIFTNFFSWSIELGGEPIGANLDLDLGCTVVDDGTAVLQLACPQFDLAITHQGEVSQDIPDVAGTSVQVRLITDDNWFPGEWWLRLDFVGLSKSVFLIEATTLAPPAPIQWVAPWGLAIVAECPMIDDGCGEWVNQTLGVSREGVALELLQGEQGTLGGGALKMWNELSWRYETIGPACDAASSYKKVALVSENLVESEVCTPGETDPCGTGLECCYPCGIPDCDFVCTPEDPQTRGCPPPPP